MEQKLAFKECVDLIAGQDTRLSWLVRGEIGIGKSSMAKVIAERLASTTGKAYKHLVLDCANLSEGDLCIPMPRKRGDVLETVFAPNALFGITDGQPIVLLLDEYLKASKPVQDALNPVLEARRVGGFQLPEGSAVIATGNMVGEGVGDKIQPHTLNRMVDITMRKPTSQEWLEWAMPAGVPSEIIAFVNQFPTCFQSYTEGEHAKSNSYIYNPKESARTAFVTPRSLERAGWLVHNRKNVPANGLFHALVGTAGEAFARDMTTLLTISDQLPSWEAVLDKPKTTPVPDNQVAQLILGLNLIRVTDAERVDNMLVYVERLGKEVQSVVMSQLFTLNTANTYAFMTSQHYKGNAEKLRKFFEKTKG